MKKKIVEQTDVSALAESILSSPKYRSFGIPIETIYDLLEREQRRYRDPKQIEKAVRRKLHNIMAPYLEDLDYQQAADWLNQLQPGSSQEDVKEVCSRIMAAHASTRERLPFLTEFYSRIFDVIGIPESILDLACGLHPFSFPWMGLPLSTRLYAFDIHQPRIALINQFFSLVGLEPLAKMSDVLVDPPINKADAAFLFKEAHRMEKREPGCSRSFWLAIRARFLLISLPSVSLHGKYNLTAKHRKLVEETVSGLPWQLTELVFPNEMVFVLDKGAGVDA